MARVASKPLRAPELLEAFQQAVFLVCDDLAEKIVGDGEKVTKLVELVVEGCQTDSRCRESRPRCWQLAA